MSNGMNADSITVVGLKVGPSHASWRQAFDVLLFLNGLCEQSPQSLDSVQVAVPQDMPCSVDPLELLHILSETPESGCRLPEGDWRLVLRVYPDATSDITELANFILLARAQSNYERGSVAPTNLPRVSLWIDIAETPEEAKFAVVQRIKYLFGEIAGLHGLAGYQSLHSAVWIQREPTRAPTNISRLTVPPTDSFPAMLVNRDSHLIFGHKFRQISPQEPLRISVCQELEKRVGELKAAKRSHMSLLGAELASLLEEGKSGTGPLSSVSLLALIILTKSLENVDGRLGKWLKEIETKSLGPQSDKPDKRKLVREWLLLETRQADFIAQTLMNLTDNVCQHSADREGMLLFQIRRSGKEENKEQRERSQLKQVIGEDLPDETRYAVFTVADCSLTAKDLAHTFQQEFLSGPESGLQEDIRRVFHEELTVRSFFDSSSRSSSLEGAWETYRDSKDSGGLERYWRHKGLLSFSEDMAGLSLSSDSPIRAHFTVESNSANPGHSREENAQGYQSATRKGLLRSGLPGTRFVVAIPLDFTHPARVRVLAEPSQPPRSEDWSQYLTYSSRQISLPPPKLENGAYDAESVIRAWASELSKKGNHAHDQVLEVDMREIPANKVGKPLGEVCAKAVLARSAPLSPPGPIVFHHCSADFIERFDAFVFAWAVEASLSDSRLSGDVALMLDESAHPRDDNFDPYSSMVIYRLESPQSTGLLTRRWAQVRGFLEAVFPLPFSIEQRWGLRDTGLQTSRAYKLRERIKEVGSDGIATVPPLHVLAEHSGARFGPMSSTPFEGHARKVLETELLGRKLGCRLPRIHMRLGSTIHLQDFYEGELLFGTATYSRDFAFLCVKAAFGPGMHIPSEVLLYGYAVYSETLILEICRLIRGYAESISRSVSVEYLIYERQADTRGTSIGESVRGIRDVTLEHPSLLVVLPIGTTMKTTLKMLRQLKQPHIGKGVTSLVEEMTDLAAMQSKRKLNCVTCVAVGATEESHNENNPFWSLNANKRKLFELVPPADDGDPTLSKETSGMQGTLMSLKNEPFHVDFLVPVDARFHYPFPSRVSGSSFPPEKLCELCFPDDPVKEEPLIETNPDSTVPSLAMRPRGDGGDVAQGETNQAPSLIEIVEQQFENLTPLKGNVLYPHYGRNDHHAEYYVRTEKLVQEKATEIGDKLEEWRESNLSENCADNVAHFLVAPSHFSNRQFVDLVRDKVFHNRAEIISIDAHKDYRGTFEARYSHIREQMQAGSRRKFSFHFVDDAVNTGDTLLRAKSFVTSLIAEQAHPPGGKVFDRYFLAIRRGSLSSWRSLLDAPALNDYDLKERVFSYVDVQIPHPQNHSNSCQWCRRNAEAEDLEHQSVGQSLANHFQKEYQRTRLKPVAKYSSPPVQVPATEDKQAWKEHLGWRRLYCSQVARAALAKFTMGPWPTDEAGVKAVDNQIADLLESGTPTQAIPGHGEKLDFQLSYIEALARPSLCEYPVIRRAIMHMLLDIGTRFLNSDVDPGITNLWPGEETYGLRNIANKAWSEHCQHKCRCPTKGQGQDLCPLWHLLKLVISRLADLRSTWLFRPKLAVGLMRLIVRLFGEHDELARVQMAGIKTALHATSDTSWSAWLDRELRDEIRWVNGKPFPAKPEDPLFDPDNPYECQFIINLVLENNRVYRVAIEYLQSLLDDKLRLEDQHEEWLKDPVAYIQVNGDWLGDTIRLLEGADPSAVYDDYILKNVRECARKWGSSAEEAIAWTVVLLRYLRSAFQKPDESSKSARNSQKVLPGDRYNNVAKLISKVLGGKAHAQLVGSFVPPHEMWKFAPPYAPSNQESTEGRSFVSFGNTQPELSGRLVEVADEQALREVLAGQEDWRILVRPSSDPDVPPNLVWTRVLKDGEFKGVVAAPAVPGTVFLLLVNTMTFYSLTWETVDRARLVLMLRHALEERLLGGVGAHAIHQFVADSYRNRMLSIPKADSHSPKAEEKAAREVLKQEAPPNNDSDIIRYLLSGLTVSKMYRTALTDSWGIGKVDFLSLDEALKDVPRTLAQLPNPDKLKGTEQSNSEESPEDANVGRATLKIVIEGAVADWDIGCLLSESGHDRTAFPIEDIIVSVAKNAFDHSVNREENYEVHISALEDDGNSGFLRITTSPADLNKDRVKTIRESLNGRLLSWPDQPVTFWALGRLVERINRLDAEAKEPRFVRENNDLASIRPRLVSGAEDRQLIIDLPVLSRAKRAVDSS